MSNEQPFWQHKKLTEMSAVEWESLCDGCGKCCLHKLQDEDTDELVFTSISCRYLDSETCRCQVYSKRKRLVPECLTLSATDLGSLKWLPSSCAYRLLHEGHDLPYWHPLVCGERQTLHLDQMSVKNKVISEDQVAEEDWEDYIIDDLS